MRIKYGMNVKTLPHRSSVRICAAFLSVAAAIFICLCSCTAGSIRYRVRYYIVYCYALAAGESGAYADVIKGEGGAGYMFAYGGKTYACAACYVLHGKAEARAAALTARGLKSGVLVAERTSFPLTNYNAERNAKLYAANLSALDGAVRTAGDCAEFLEGGGGTGKARANMRLVADELDALLQENRSDCFTSALAELVALAEECAYGEALLVRELLYFQLAAADAVLNTVLT